MSKTSTIPAETPVVAGRTLAEWVEFSRRDDCLERMVPSDLRGLVNALSSATQAKVCDHPGYSFDKHGRCCPTCNDLIVDFGD